MGGSSERVRYGPAPRLREDDTRRSVVCEGTSYGEHQDGPWRAGVPDWGAGRWCDVFEIRDWQIQRCFIYLDPDYAGKDTARYPWLAAVAEQVPA